MITVIFEPLEAPCTSCQEIVRYTCDKKKIEVYIPRNKNYCVNCGSSILVQCTRSALTGKTLHSVAHVEYWKTTTDWCGTWSSSEGWEFSRSIKSTHFIGT